MRLWFSCQLGLQSFQAWTGSERFASKLTHMGLAIGIPTTWQPAETQQYKKEITKAQGETPSFIYPNLRSDIPLVCQPWYDVERDNSRV